MLSHASNIIAECNILACNYPWYIHVYVLLNSQIVIIVRLSGCIIERFARSYINLAVQQLKQKNVRTCSLVWPKKLKL